MSGDPHTWSIFLYPPTQKTVMFNISAQDAVNVSWVTRSTCEHNFQDIILRYWWSGPWGADFDPITMENVLLNESRIFRVNNGPSYPAAGYFDLAYRLPNGTIVSGSGGLGFAVNNYDPTAPGKLWSQGGPSPLPANMTTQTQTSTAPTATAPLVLQTVTALPSSAPTSNGGLETQVIAAIIVSISIVLLMVFLAILFAMRRRWKQQLIASQRQMLHNGGRGNSELYEAREREEAISPLSTQALEKDGRNLRSELPSDATELPTPTDVVPDFAKAFDPRATPQSLLKDLMARKRPG